MTREEAREILTHNWTRVDNPNYSESELDEAFFMAIEALKAEETIEIKPMEIKGEFHIDDIDKNRRSIFEDIVWVVRCKDCRHYQKVSWTKEMRCVNPYWATARGTVETDFCSYGERREE